MGNSVATAAAEKTRRQVRRVEGRLLQTLGKGEELEAEFKQRRTRLLKQLNRPVVVEQKDMFTFTISVSVTLITAYMMGAFPALVTYWYAGWLVSLMLVRFLYFHSRAWHFFMIDYCYLHNLTLCLFLFLYPQSTELYQLLFTGSNGMLLLAIPLWNNALVFHDFDKVTSCYIHLLPAMIQFTIKWAPQPLTPNLHDTTLTFGRIVYLHTVIYAAWQFSYLMFTEKADKDTIESKNYITSFRWLVNHPPGGKKGILYRFTGLLGERYRKLMFVILQFTMHLIALIPLPFIYDNRVAHSMYLLAFWLCAIWNGARFYIQKFSVEYHDRIQKMYNIAQEVEALAMHSLASPRYNNNSSNTKINNEHRTEDAENSKKD
eukprot:PhM_4_TR6469/c0_g1_i1/m.3590